MAEQQDIPKHWAIVSLRELVLSQKGKRPSVLKKQKFSSSLPYLDIKAIEKGIVTKYSDTYSPFVASDLDLLVVWDGSRSGWVGKGSKGAIGSTIMSITPILTVQNYLYYFLSSKFKLLNKRTTGVGIPHVDSELFWNLPIPLPPLNEQREIAETLDDFFYQLDYYEKRLANIPRALEMYREMVLEQAVSGELTKDWRKENNIISTWDNLKGNEIFEFITSGSRGWAKYYSDKGKFFIRITNLNYENLEIDMRPSKVKYVDLPKNVEGKRTRVKEGDILISITGYLGMVGIVTKNLPEAYVNQHIALARPNSNIFPNYIGLYLKSTKGQKQFSKMKRGTVKAGLSLQDIKDLEIPIPSLAEQKEIVHQVTTRFKKADQIEKEEYQKIFFLLQLIREKVLKKAFNGTLVKPVEEEMSVEELLETIKVEKAEIEQQRKQARKNRKRQPKPPKMTKETLKKIIQEEFEGKTFDYKELQNILEGKVTKGKDFYDDFKDALFELIRPNLEDGTAFLQANFENGITLTIKPTNDEAEKS